MCHKMGSAAMTTGSAEFLTKGLRGAEEAEGGLRAVIGQRRIPH
jgi:hypothetical protein